MAHTPAATSSSSARTTTHPTVWQNVPEKHRVCEDRGRHGGRLEIVTWDSPPDTDDEPLDWGATLKEESEELKQKFEVEMHGDFEKFYEYWPQGFRWTCCGLPGDYKWGCDSHIYPGCRCDNCRYGYKLPNGFVEEIK